MNERSFSILLVEDNPGDRQTISWGIRRRLPRVEIHEAVSGGQCLSFLSKLKSRVDIIVLDFELPDMNGLQVLGKLKEMGYRKTAIGFTRFDGDELKQMVEACARNAFCKNRQPEFLDYLTNLTEELEGV